MSLYSVGCSGYYYPPWKGKFYPAGLAPKNWLQYYSSIFNTVELNGTSYRTPTLTTLKKYVLQTPEEFKFSVKVSKYITHVLKLKESKQPIADFQQLIDEGLGNKIAYFLFQLPPSFHYSEENLELIVNNITNDSRNVIEFRHLSWWNDAVKQALTDAHLTFCNVDYPGLKSYFIITSSSFYLRLHGNPELFKSSYSIIKLENFYKNFPSEANHNSIYFNNTFYEAGYTNALQLKKIVDKHILNQKTINRV